MGNRKQGMNPLFAAQSAAIAAHMFHTATEGRARPSMTDGVTATV